MTAFLLTLCLLGAPAPRVDPPELQAARAACATFDHQRAVELLLPLGRRGNVPAQRMLGWLYSNGQGVERDAREAARWYCESVRRDPYDGAPCAWLTLLVREEPGVVWESLEPMGVERWRKYVDAAERGDAEAQVVLGLIYSAGLETERDLVLAYKWFAIAAEQHHPTAGQLLEKIENEMSPEQIAEGRRRAAGFRPVAPER